MMAYHVPLYGGWFMPYNTPEDSFWCCTGTGVENHAKYGDSIYWHDADGLYVNLFIPSELSWSERGVTLRQTTRYPEEDSTRLEVTCAQPTKMSLRIRYPAWAQNELTVTVNGKPVRHQAKPGSFVAIERTWSKDRVEVRIPMSLRLEAMPDDSSRVAIFYGPVILAGALGTEGIAPPMPYAKNQGDYFRTKPAAIPVLITANRQVDSWIEPVPGKPLTFRTKGVGRPAEVTLTAFYALPPQRYSLYWDLMTDEQWQKREAAGEAEDRREKELEARTADAVRIGDPESERAHKLQGEQTQTGEFHDRQWRHATDGGWFSYELAVPADSPSDLLCTYWGSDSGSRRVRYPRRRPEVRHANPGHERSRQVLRRRLSDPLRVRPGQDARRREVSGPAWLLCGRGLRLPHRAPRPVTCALLYQRQEPSSKVVSRNSAYE